MTYEEFAERIESGQKVLCGSSEERRDILELLESLGYELSPSSRRHIMNCKLNPDFLCPGMEDYQDEITCYRTTFVEEIYKGAPNSVILYEEAMTAMPSISRDEFDASFHELCGIAG